MFGVEHSFGQGPGWRSGERKFPTFHPDFGGKVLKGVFVSGDLRPFRVQPLVAVGVVEMPVRVDQMLYRFRAEARQRLQDSIPRRRDSGVHEQFAIAPCEHGDIAAGALENADVPAKLRNRNLGVCCCLADGYDGAHLLGEEAALVEADPARRETSDRKEAAA